MEDSESRRESRSSQRAAKTALDVRQAAAQVSKLLIVELALSSYQLPRQEKRRSMEAERKLKLKVLLYCQLTQCFVKLHVRCAWMQEKEDRRLQTQRRRALAKEKAQERKEAKAEELARRAEEVQQ